jgi:hypothetical protein
MTERRAMSLAIVMPVVLQQPQLLDSTLEAVRHLCARCEPTLYVICNGLHVCTDRELHAQLSGCFSGHVRVVHEPGVIRSVAGSWNEGARRAIEEGADYIAAIANDALLKPDGLDRLLEFGELGTADLWSGISYNDRDGIDPSSVTDGADFTCFMFRPDTIHRFGWFDTNFKPAYFEDNDYYARVVLGGGCCRVVHAVQFYHHGSMTIRMDPIAAHHVNHWFGLNQRYFSRKWGVNSPAASSEEVIARYYHHPFNDPAQPVTWFPENGNS